jgi:CHAT domain-containing protein
MLRGTPAPSTPALGNAEPRTGVNWRHPFYWAPFVLSGNWL